MEFTPKKVSPFSQVRGPVYQSRYSSGGKSYLNRYKHNSSNRIKPYSEPPRKVKNNFTPKSGRKGFFNSMSDNKSRENTIVSRGESLLKASLTSTQKEQQKSSYVRRNVIEPSSSSSSSSSCLESFLNNNENVRLNNQGEPSTVFTDSDDDDIFLNAKYSPKNNSDKENDDGSSTSKFYSKKKKTPVIRRSSNLSGVIRRSTILSDISPAKVERAYGHVNTINSRSQSASPQSRIPIPANDEVTPEDTKVVIVDDPHEIGFLNYGNTCYLNAVLQSLLGLLPFISDISSIVRELDLPTSSITHSLWKVIVDRQHIDVTGIRKSLRHIKQNLEKVDGSFSGFKMQDANEFLTQVLDTVKDEINRSILASAESQNANSSDRSERISLRSPQYDRELKTDNLCSTSNSSLLNSSTLNNSDPLQQRLRDEGYTSSEECEIVLVKKGDDSPDISLLTKSTDSAMESELSSSNLLQLFSEKDNPIDKNFEFELLESYRCLGCGHVEGRKQSHYALYVDLPKEGEESIQEAVEAYMGDDQRELTCDKCNYKQALVTTSFNRFPRILIVQMKRYEYKPDQLECIKVSSKVKVDMWLNLDKLALDDVKLPQNWVPSPLNISVLDKKLNRTARNLFDDQSDCVDSTCDNSGEKSTATTSSNEDAGSIECIPDNTGDQQLMVVDKEKSSERSDNASSNCTALVPFGPAPEPASQWSDENSLKCNEELEKAKEEKELQEVMLRSMEDSGPPAGGANNHESEEEEIQKAIRLSLQDMGMCYSSDVDSNVEQQNSDIYESPVKETTSGTNSYRLLSLISHFGLTTCTGHYVSDVYNCSKSQWFHYDDEVVAKLQEAVVLAEGRQKNGYIFFYAHNDICQQQSTSPL